VSADSIVTIGNLRKRFGTNEVLKGIDLEVKRGEVIAIIGKSGSGKSTLLRCVNGLEEFQEGSLQVEGQALRHGDAKAMRSLRQHVGMIFQSFNLFPHLTALENVALPLRIVHGTEEGAARRRALEVLEQFGLEAHVEKRPAELSGGQQQRVALARAIAPKPKLLLLDEPTSALDPMMTQDVLDLIRGLAEGGQRIVLSTHEIAFARKVADWVLFLEHGKIVESAPAREFFESPQHGTAKEFLEALTRYR